MYMLSVFQLLSLALIASAFVAGAYLGQLFDPASQIGPDWMGYVAFVGGVVFTSVPARMLRQLNQWVCLFVVELNAMLWGLLAGLVASHYAAGVSTPAIGFAVLLWLSVALFRLSIAAWNKPILIALHTLLWMAVILKSWASADLWPFWSIWSLVVLVGCIETWAWIPRLERLKPLEFANTLYLNWLTPPAILARN